MYVCMYVGMYVCTSVYIYIYMFMCIYIYIERERGNIEKGLRYDSKIHETRPITQQLCQALNHQLSENGTPVPRGPLGFQQWSILCCLSSISSLHSFPSKKYRGTFQPHHLLDLMYV